MKKIKKILKFTFLILIINQLIILVSNNSIKNGFWKISRENRFNERDFLNFNSNSNLKLKWNVIVDTKNDNLGIIHLYTGDNLLVSNSTFTKWYLYNNKNSKHAHNKTRK